MTHEELLQVFDSQYDKMSHSSNASIMKGFGRVFRESFNMMASYHPEEAENILEELKTIICNNYLSCKEAEDIIQSFVNSDNSKGPHWTKDEIEYLLSSRGYPKCEDGYYNFYALVTTINMVYSDMSTVLVELFGHNSIEESCYKLALCHLKDVDRPRWIRRYFNLQ